MTDGDLDLREWEKLVSYRTRRLVKLGVPDDVAELIASARDMSWHEVEGLIKAGCDPGLAARIVA